MMNDASLYEATVPVFQHYLRRIDALLLAVPSDQLTALDRRLAPTAFSAAEHFSTAIGFVSRTVLPLLARDLPAEDVDTCKLDKLRQAGQHASALLEELCVTDFDGASQQLISHTAGAAELEQNATTFVTRFALPNFFFHLSMGFAILRQAGVDIGKADFDGQHVYAPGFHF